MCAVTLCSLLVAVSDAVGLSIFIHKTLLGAQSPSLLPQKLQVHLILDGLHCKDIYLQATKQAEILIKHLAIKVLDRSILGGQQLASLLMPLSCNRLS